MKNGLYLIIVLVGFSRAALSNSTFVFDAGLSPNDFLSGPLLYNKLMDKKTDMHSDLVDNKDRDERMDALGNRQIRRCLNPSSIKERDLAKGTGDVQFWDPSLKVSLISNYMVNMNLRKNNDGGYYLRLNNGSVFNEVEDLDVKDVINLYNCMNKANLYMSSRDETLLTDLFSTILIEDPKYSPCQWLQSSKNPFKLDRFFHQLVNFSTGSDIKVVYPPTRQNCKKISEYFEKNPVFRESFSNETLQKGCDDSIAALLKTGLDLASMQEVEVKAFKGIYPEQVLSDNTLKCMPNRISTNVKKAILTSSCYRKFANTDKGKAAITGMRGSVNAALKSFKKRDNSRLIELKNNQVEAVEKILNVDFRQGGTALIKEVLQNSGSKNKEYSHSLQMILDKMVSNTTLFPFIATEDEKAKYDKILEEFLVPAARKLSRDPRPQNLKGTKEGNISFQEFFGPGTKVFNQLKPKEELCMITSTKKNRSLMESICDLLEGESPLAGVKAIFRQNKLAEYKGRGFEPYIDRFSAHYFRAIECKMDPRFSDTIKGFDKEIKLIKKFSCEPIADSVVSLLESDPENPFLPSPKEIYGIMDHERIVVPNKKNSEIVTTKIKKETSSLDSEKKKEVASSENSNIASPSKVERKFDASNSFPTVGMPTDNSATTYNPIYNPVKSSSTTNKEVVTQNIPRSVKDEKQGDVGKDADSSKLKALQSKIDSLSDELAKVKNEKELNSIQGQIDAEKEKIAAIKKSQKQPVNTNNFSTETSTHQGNFKNIKSPVSEEKVSPLNQPFTNAPKNQAISTPANQLVKSQQESPQGQNNLQGSRSSSSNSLSLSVASLDDLKNPGYSTNSDYVLVEEGGKFVVYKKRFSDNGEGLTFVKVPKLACLNMKECEKDILKLESGKKTKKKSGKKKIVKKPKKKEKALSKEEIEQLNNYEMMDRDVNGN